MYRTTVRSFHHVQDPTLFMHVGMNHVYRDVVFRPFACESECDAPRDRHGNIQMVAILLSGKARLTGGAGVAISGYQFRNWSLSVYTPHP